MLDQPTAAVIAALIGLMGAGVGALAAGYQSRRVASSAMETLVTSHEQELKRLAVEQSHEFQRISEEHELELARLSREHLLELQRSQRTEFMAEMTARKHLSDPRWTDRSFELLKRRLGVFDSEDELRRVLVRAGAVRVIRARDGKEFWRLTSRQAKHAPDEDEEDEE